MATFFPFSKVNFGRLITYDITEFLIYVITPIVLIYVYTIFFDKVVKIKLLLKYLIIVLTIIASSYYGYSAVGVHLTEKEKEKFKVLHEIHRYLINSNIDKYFHYSSYDDFKHNLKNNPSYRVKVFKYLLIGSDYSTDIKPFAWFEGVIKGLSDNRLNELSDDNNAFEKRKLYLFDINQDFIAYFPTTPTSNTVPPYITLHKYYVDKKENVRYDATVFDLDFEPDDKYFIINFLKGEESSTKGISHSIEKFLINDNKAVSYVLEYDDLDNAPVIKYSALIMSEKKLFKWSVQGYVTNKKELNRLFQQTLKYIIVH
jgi:hypothetical protein